MDRRSVFFRVCIHRRYLLQSVSDELLWVFQKIIWGNAVHGSYFVNDSPVYILELNEFIIVPSDIPASNNGRPSAGTLFGTTL